jgi:hypothetical protein
LDKDLKLQQQHFKVLEIQPHLFSVDLDLSNFFSYVVSHFLNLIVRKSLREKKYLRREKKKLKLLPHDQREKKKIGIDGNQIFCILHVHFSNQRGHGFVIRN